MSTQLKYVHLLRAMRAGDVLYLTEHIPRLDKSIVIAVARAGGQCETACFVATNLDPATAHRVVRVTMITPLNKARPRGRPRKG
jgi:hypothetical protein